LIARRNLTHSEQTFSESGAMILFPQAVIDVVMRKGSVRIEGGEQFLQLPGPAGTPRIELSEHLLDRQFRVHAAGIDCKAPSLGGEAAVGFRWPEIMTDQVHQVGGILAVVYRAGSRPMRSAYCLPISLDRYGRTVATCLVGGDVRSVPASSLPCAGGRTNPPAQCYQ